MKTVKNADYSSILQTPPSQLLKLQKTRGWAQSFIGLVVYGILRIVGLKPKDYYGICKYFEIGTSSNGVEMGWFFICGKRADDRLKNHEVGHCLQNAEVGGLQMLFLSFCSVIRYWYRAIAKPKDSYYSWWFEEQATNLGDKYVAVHRHK